MGFRSFWSMSTGKHKAKGQVTPLLGGPRRARVLMNSCGEESSSLLLSGMSESTFNSRH